MSRVALILALLLSFSANGYSQQLGGTAYMLQWQPVYTPANVIAVPRRGWFGRTSYSIKLMPAAQPVPSAQLPQQSPVIQQPPAVPHAHHYYLCPYCRR